MLVKYAQPCLLQCLAPVPHKNTTALNGPMISAKAGYELHSVVALITSRWPIRSVCRAVCHSVFRVHLFTAGPADSLWGKNDDYEDDCVACKCAHSMLCHVLCKP